MALPTAEIEVAFIARYRNDATLQGLLTGAVAPLYNIFDQGGVPTNQAFPYVVVFPIMSQIGEDIAFGTDAVDVFMQVSMFTQVGASAGFAQARAIAKQVYKLTDQKALDLSSSGFNQYLLLFENEQERPPTDGITQQIIHRYRCNTQG
jgi:hypothetical protein